MSLMMRKLKRSAARHAMEQQQIDIFGKYAPKKVPVRNKRTGKFQYEEVNKSFFARSWRSWA